MKKVLLFTALILLLSCQKDEQVNINSSEDYKARKENYNEDIITGKAYFDGGIPASDMNISLYVDGDTLYGKTDVNGMFIINIE
jgi:hypothetical protein